MKIIKKGLDELQKQILSGIESRGFWIAFWGSLILLIVQMIFANNIISVISSWLPHDTGSRRGDSAGGELFAFLHGGGADGTADRHGTV